MHNRLLARPRVDAALHDAAAAARLVILDAPLGAGKTTALAQAFADRNGVAWMDARPWHRAAFAGPLIEAIRAVRPDFGRITLGSLEAGASYERAAMTFAAELRHVNAPLTIVVDNVAVFGGDDAFVRFVETALPELPERVGIVLAGRSIPELALAEGVARGSVAIVPARTLAFDSSEILALARQLERPIGESRAGEILHATEGWAAGVMLAIASGDAASYLTQGLLHGLDEPDVAFLEISSVFDELDVRMLETLEVFAGAQDRIAALRRHGALVTEVAAGRYRLHPLLRDLAQDRLRARGALELAHRHAVQAYAANGEIAAALFHAIAAGDAESGAAFLRAHAHAAVATGNYRAVNAIVEAIDVNGPDADVRWFTGGLIAKATASLEDARIDFVRAAMAAQGTKGASISFMARAQTIEHDIGHLCHVEEAYLDDLQQRAKGLDDAARATAATLRGWARAVAHDFAGALACAPSTPAGADPLARFTVEILRAYAQSALGEIEPAEATLDALTTSLENDDRVVLQTLALVWFARLALAWGKTNAAADAADQARRLSSALELRAEEAALYSALTELASHRGDVQATVRLAEVARGRADRAWYAADRHRVRAFAEIALARAAFLGHDNAIARELAQRVAATQHVPSTQRAVALAESAVYTLLCEPRDSAQAIESARDAIAAAVPIDLADAVALSTADDVIAFLDAANGNAHASLLGNACKPFDALLARRRGLVTLELAGLAVGNARRGTTAGAAAFDTALEQLTRDGPRFEGRLARAYAATFIKPKSATPEAPPQLDLTAREREILALLVDGLTNKEIAQRLIVSPRTVETHVERVLGKLEVGSRSRAIAKAIRLGIVAL